MCNFLYVNKAAFCNSLAIMNHQQLPCVPSTMHQIAGIFEFTGAMVLGGETTKTVASDIANMMMFTDAPDVGFFLLPRLLIGLPFDW